MRRPDQELLEAVGPDLEEMMWEAVSAQLTYESVPAGTDRQKEVARRRALYTIGVKRGWNVCGWCEEEVDLYEWATGRLCGHQFHHVSNLRMELRQHRPILGIVFRDVSWKWATGAAGTGDGQCVRRGVATPRCGSAPRCWPRRGGRCRDRWDRRGQA